MADFLVKQGREIGGVSLVTDAGVSHKVDLTSIIETGTTASQAISAGTYFYLNDTLVRAKVAIASGATFTLNTNYEVVTAGGLNDLYNRISNKTNAVLSFTGILNASSDKAFCTSVCVDLANVLTEYNKMAMIGYVYGGVDVFVGYAVKRDTGHIIGVLSSASASYATYNFTYQISNGSIRVTKITGTQL